MCWVGALAQRDAPHAHEGRVKLIHNGDLWSDVAISLLYNGARRRADQAESAQSRSPITSKPNRSLADAYGTSTAR